jgi:microcystin degradation protein MlrC
VSLIWADPGVSGGTNGIKEYPFDRLGRDREYVMTYTVVCGSVQHETNTFVEDPTDRDDFQERRELFGPDVPVVPVVVALDLHGNVSDRATTHADAVLGFETYPHLDKADTGR